MKIDEVLGLSKLEIFSAFALAGYLAAEPESEETPEAFQDRMADLAVETAEALIKRLNRGAQ